MTPLLTALVWLLVLAIVQVLLHAGARNRETGLAYNAGPRDERGPAEGELTGRLRRAKENLYENLPLFGFAVVVAWAAHRETHLVDLAAWTFVACRVLYVPLYALGIRYVRSAVWVVSLVALCVILFELLKPLP